MVKAIRLPIDKVKAKLGGYDHFWSTILEKTTPEQPEFTYHDIDYACHVGFESVLRKFLQLLVKNGFVDVAKKRTNAHNGHVYRVLIRQRATPSFTRTGTISKVGEAQQNMWNVMRRERQGFTVEQLGVAASTDSIFVSHQYAKDYCRRLVNAGVLIIQTPGKWGSHRNIFVLRGSANTGPKAPRKFRCEFMFDPNSGCVLGDTEASEVSQ